MSRRIGLALVALLAAAVSAGSCGGAQITAQGPRKVHGLEASRITGPYVPAGTQFSAVVDRTVDSGTSPSGTVFLLRTTAPLVDTTGRVVAPAGAAIRAQLDSTGPADAPALKLRLQSIATVRGPAPLQAAVRRAEHETYRSTGPRDRPVSSFGNNRINSYDGAGFGWTAVGGGPGSYRVGSFYPREVRLPAGARVDLVLTRDVIPPGTTVQLTP